eukprot:6318686-Pyramimonas_sp.AAC.1
MTSTTAQHPHVLWIISGDMCYGAPGTAADEEVKQKVHASLLESLVKAQRLSQLAPHFRTAPKV